MADINAAGGANGRMLKLVVLDTQANPQVGIDVVTRLTSVEKVPLIVTGWSAVIAAVAPVVNRSQVLSIVMGANSPRIATMGDYVYTGYPLADVDIVAMAKYTRQELKKERAAVIHLNDESGVYGARIFRDTFEKLGGKIVAFESYEPNSTDYTGAGSISRAMPATRRRSSSRCVSSASRCRSRPTARPTTRSWSSRSAPRPTV